MKMIKVDSSMIREYGYEEEVEVLKIMFSNGKAIEYLNVPQEVVDEMADSESIGKFFHKEIKNRFTHRDA